MAVPTSKGVFLDRINLKGPAGVVTTDKRVIVNQVNLHGSTDKRVIVNAVSLTAPPPDARVIVSRVNLHGPNAPLRPIYIKTSSGWQAADIYVAIGGVWKKVTP